MITIYTFRMESRKNEKNNYSHGIKLLLTGMLPGLWIG
jgi:hypothetical protein